MMLLHLERMLERAREDYAEAMKVYDSGGLVVEYDTDYYEGQVLALEHAVEVAKQYAHDMQEERDKQWYEDWEAVEDVIADIEYRQNVLAQSFTLEDVRNRLEWLKTDQADGTIAIVR